jgi:hypothetical protein
MATITSVLSAEIACTAKFVNNILDEDVKDEAATSMVA